MREARDMRAAPLLEATRALLALPLPRARQRAFSSPHALRLFACRLMPPPLSMPRYAEASATCRRLMPPMPRVNMRCRALCAR